MFAQDKRKMELIPRQFAQLGGGDQTTDQTNHCIDWDALAVHVTTTSNYLPAYVRT